jgi:hypothetical protein
MNGAVNLAMGIAGAAMEVNDEPLKNIRGPKPIVRRVNEMAKRLKKMETKQRGPMRIVCVESGLFVTVEINATRVEIITE